MEAKDFSFGCLTGVFVALGGLACLFVLGLFLVGSAFNDAAERLTELEENPGAETQLPDKKFLYGSKSENVPTVLRIRLSGVIMNTRRSSLLDVEEDTSANAALRQIRMATKDHSVRGILLELDTPGGEVTCADILADALQRFRHSNTNRFVLTHMGSLCCSGGYYIAAGSDCIMAHPTTLTGSIGVIMHGVNAAGLAEKVGVKSVVIATGANKALLDPLSPVDPQHVEILRKAVQDDYDRFLSIVSKGRGITLETLRPLADGRVLSAPDALKHKLVDCLGYRDEATKKLAQLAKVKAVRVCAYEDDRGYFHRIFSCFVPTSAQPQAIAQAVSGAIDEASTPRLEYRMR